MPASKPLRKKLLTDPSQLPDAEREYYRTQWEFDPVQDCRPFIRG